MICLHGYCVLLLMVHNGRPKHAVSVSLGHWLLDLIFANDELRVRGRLCYFL